jgi:hypothetical protein
MASPGTSRTWRSQLGCYSANVGVPSRRFRNSAKNSAGLAGRRLPTERWQDNATMSPWSICGASICLHICFGNVRWQPARCRTGCSSENASRTKRRANPGHCKAEAELELHQLRRTKPAKSVAARHRDLPLAVASRSDSSRGGRIGARDPDSDLRHCFTCIGCSMKATGLPPLPVERLSNGRSCASTAARACLFAALYRMVAISRVRRMSRELSCDSNGYRCSVSRAGGRPRLNRLPN